MYKHEFDYEFENEEDFFNYFDEENPDIYNLDFRNIGEKYMNAECDYEEEFEEYQHYGFTSSKKNPINAPTELIESQSISIDIPDDTRDRALSNKLKARYNYCCQICNEKLQLAPNKFLVHTHHLHSIGDNGPDIQENMIVVCVSCHALLDFGSMYIDPNTYIINHFNRNEKLHGKKMKVLHYINKIHLNYQKEKFISL